MKATRNILIGLMIAIASNAMAQNTAKVVRVVDGDTYKLLSNGKIITTRLVNVDAPETKQNFGEAAKQQATEILIGHTSIEQQLLYMLDHHRFPHGFIFSGLEGVGKSVMAYRLARYLFSKDHKSEDSSGLFGETLVSPSSPSLSSSLYI